MSDKIRDMQFMGLADIVNGLAAIIATLKETDQIIGAVCGFLSSLDDRLEEVRDSVFAANILTEIDTQIGDRLVSGEWGDEEECDA